MIEFALDHCSSAEELLSKLRLSHKKWFYFHESKFTLPDTDWSRGWIFRGQGDSSWKVIPSAWRSPDSGQPVTINRIQKKYDNSPVRAAIRYFLEETVEFEQTQLEKQEWLIDLLLYEICERSLITEFAKLGDELGYKIPDFRAWSLIEVDDNERIESYVKKRNDEIFHGKIHHEISWTHPIVALAQHHTIPTRLLDWTLNPLAAAFFAASSNIELQTKENPPATLAIYAIHNSYTHHQISDLRIVRVPARDNDYLRAQGGLFTLQTSVVQHYLDTGHYPTVEHTSVLGQDEMAGFYPKAVPRKFVLPSSEAASLLRLLWIERTTIAHLMPSLDYVAKAVSSRWELIDSFNPFRSG